MKCLHKDPQSYLVTEPGSLTYPPSYRKVWWYRSDFYNYGGTVSTKSTTRKPLSSWCNSASIPWLAQEQICPLLHPSPSLSPGCNTNGTPHSQCARTRGECHTRFQHIIFVQASIVYGGQVWDPAPCPRPAPPLGSSWSSYVVNEQQRQNEWVEIVSACFKQRFLFLNHLKRLWFFLLLHHDSLTCWC